MVVLFLTKLWLSLTRNPQQEMLVTQVGNIKVSIVGKPNRPVMITYHDIGLNSKWFAYKNIEMLISCTTPLKLFNNTPVLWWYLSM